MGVGGVTWFNNRKLPVNYTQLERHYLRLLHRAQWRDFERKRLYEVLGKGSRGRIARQDNAVDTN